MSTLSILLESMWAVSTMDDGKQGIHISLAWEGPGINEIGLSHSAFPFTGLLWLFLLLLSLLFCFAFFVF